jgi:hypothetical protein
LAGASAPPAASRAASTITIDASTSLASIDGPVPALRQTPLTQS